MGEQLADALLEMVGRQDVQDRMKETARLYFTSDDVTINLVWSALIVGALLLLLKPLFGIPLLDNILGAMSGGGHGHSPSYGGGVSSGYGAPDAGYGAPDASYSSPDSGYSAPQSGYSRGRRSVGLSATLCDLSPSYRLLCWPTSL